jgi:hypothetical protein
MSVSNETTEDVIDKENVKNWFTKAYSKYSYLAMKSWAASISKQTKIACKCKLSIKDFYKYFTITRIRTQIIGLMNKNCVFSL